MYVHFDLFELFGLLHLEINSFVKHLEQGLLSESPLEVAGPFLKNPLLIDANLQEALRNGYLCLLGFFGLLFLLLMLGLFGLVVYANFHVNLFAHLKSGLDLLVNLIQLFHEIFL